jgi:hypothetical protein
MEDAIKDVEKALFELQDFCIKTLAEIGTMRIELAMLKNTLTKP